MHCVHCGNQINTEAHFCNKCGKSVTSISEHETESDEAYSKEWKKAIYKLESGDVEEAGKIFEDIAFTYDDPAAWIALGGNKFARLGSDEVTVQQALNCFTKASELNPSSRTEYQTTFRDFSLQSLEAFCQVYAAVKQEAKKAKSGRRWNLALAGLSAVLGNRPVNRNNGNPTFRAMAGVGGAAYGLHKAGQHFDEFKEAEGLLNFLEETIKELILGVHSFCLENREVYQEFLVKVNQLGLPNKSFAGLLGESK